MPSLPHPRRRGYALLLAIALFSRNAEAELRQVSQFDFSQDHLPSFFADPSGRFSQTAAGVAPNGDFLSFAPRLNGTWQLFRVRQWSSPQPVIDRLALPGYFSSRDMHSLEQMHAKLYFAPSGAYAICVGEAEWLKPAGKARMQDVVTVVDLKTFAIVKSQRFDPVSPFEYQSIQMDKEGRLILQHSLFEGQHRAELIPVSIPDLQPGVACGYRMVSDPSNREHPVTDTPTSCEQDLSSASLSDYLRELADTPASQNGFVCRETNGEYCPQPDHFSPDMRFGFGIRREGHDGILGGWVETRATAIVFSMKTHAEVGEVDLMREGFLVKMCTYTGKDYLLAIRDGRHLTVFQIVDPQSDPPH